MKMISTSVHWFFIQSALCTINIMIHATLYGHHHCYAQRAKSHGFRGESPGIVVVGGGNPPGNLGCKWNENPRRNSGKFLNCSWDTIAIEVISTIHLGSIIYICWTINLNILWRVWAHSTKTSMKTEYCQNNNRFDTLFKEEKQILE